MSDRGAVLAPIGSPTASSLVPRRHDALHPIVNADYDCNQRDDGWRTLEDLSCDCHDTFRHSDAVSPS